MAEQQVELIRDMNRAYAQKSIPALSNFLHPDYVHVTRPQSVNVPERNKAQYLEYFQKIFDNWAELETPVLTFVANTPGKVVVHITSDVTLKSGSVVAYESFINIHIGEGPGGAKQITYEEEFVDANAHANAFAPFVAAKV